MAEVYVSVDIEADGPIPGRYSMLSLGACVVGRPDESFYAELAPISDEFVPEALAVSGLNREDLMLRGMSARGAMERFDAWLEGIEGRPVFCSFSTWDWSFVYWYLIRELGRSPFGHSSLDIKSLLMGRFGLGWRGTSKGRLAKSHPDLLAGLPPHTHDALEDAREQAELLRRVFAAQPDVVSLDPVWR
jgi:hypothetical protein